MPGVPPGLAPLVAAAILVGVVRCRWTQAVGMLVVIAEPVRFFASGSASALNDLVPIGILAGTWIRLAGLVIAAAAGLAATHQCPRSTSAATR